MARVISLLTVYYNREVFFKISKMAAMSRHSFNIEPYGSMRFE
jgi:hypothetical protein